MKHVIGTSARVRVADPRPCTGAGATLGTVAAERVRTRSCATGTRAHRVVATCGTAERVRGVSAVGQRSGKLALRLSYCLLRTDNLLLLLLLLLLLSRTICANQIFQIEQRRDVVGVGERAGLRRVCALEATGWFRWNHRLRVACGNQTVVRRGFVGDLLFLDDVSGRWTE